MNGSEQRASITLLFKMGFWAVVNRLNRPCWSLWKLIKQQKSPGVTYV